MFQSIGRGAARDYSQANIDRLGHPGKADREPFLRPAPLASGKTDQELMEKSKRQIELPMILTSLAESRHKARRAGPHGNTCYLAQALAFLFTPHMHLLP